MHLWFSFSFETSTQTFPILYLLKSTYQVINVRRFSNKVGEEKSGKDAGVESFGAQPGSGSVLEGKEIEVLI